MKSSFNAVKMRRLLATLLVIAVAAMGAGYYFATKTLNETVAETNRYKVDVDTSSDKIAQLTRLSGRLDSYATVKKDLRRLTIDTTTTKYQDFVLEEINKLAKQNGVDIAGVTYESGASQAGDTPAPQTDTSRSPQSPSGGTGGAPTAIGGGVSAVTANVTIQGSVSYDNFLRFLMALERNLPKMQVTSVSLRPDTTNPQLLASPALKIEAYTR